ncbi:MAG: Cytochrome C family protein [Parcubacteria group bacterium GW2011_GWB1_43_8b]|nr:MAG: Cytochrome C family protein [Parcubacteria group bacterium GW2011_GWB1_43_8b]
MKIGKFFLIFLIVLGWIFSGWPQIFSFPPGVPKAYAALSYVGGVAVSRTGSTTQGQELSLTGLTGGSGSSAAAGDIVIVACSTGSTADRAIGVSTPTGYTELNEPYANGSSYDTNLSVNWKIMGSTPDASVTCGPSGSTADALSAVAYVWRGIDQITPFDVAFTTNTGTGTGQPTPPAITPSTAGTIVIAIGASAALTGAVYTTATLSNFKTTTGSDTNDSMLGMGSFAWSSGTYTPAQFGGGTTGATESWAADTLALRPAVAPTVSTQAATLKEATTATCNGTIDATGGVNSTNAGCEWDIDSGAPYANNPSTAGDYGAVPFTQPLTSLPSGTTIYARAFATNSAGTGYGGETSFLTKPGAPTGLNFTSVTATTSRLNWSSVTGAASYKVERCTGTGCSSYSEVATGVTNIYWDDSGRTGNTIYRYQVRATNATGDSAYSSGAEQLMLPDVPGTPTFSNILTNSLRVNWTAPTGPTGGLSYKVERCTGTLCSDFGQITSGETNTYYDNTGLNSGIIYRYKIRATNGTGDGNYSNADETTTAVVTISIDDYLVAFGFKALATTTKNIGDVPIITVTSGPANLNVKSTNFTSGGYTWTLDTTNGINKVLWEFSKDDSAYSTFAVAGTEYTFDTNVPDDGTRDLYLRLTMPTETSSYNQYGAAITVVATAP